MAAKDVVFLRDSLFKWLCIKSAISINIHGERAVDVFFFFLPFIAHTSKVQEREKTHDTLLGLLGEVLKDGCQCFTLLCRGCTFLAGGCTLHFHCPVAAHPAASQALLRAQLGENEDIGG